LSKAKRGKSIAAAAAKKRVAIQESAQKMKVEDLIAIGLQFLEDEEKKEEEEEVEDLIRIGLQFLKDEEEQSRKIGKVSEPSTAKAVEHQPQYSKENMIEVSSEDRMGLEVTKEEEEEELYVPSLNKLAAMAASKATEYQVEYQVKPF
jgi:hypothetical protein